MAITAIEIEYMIVNASDGDVLLRAKTGEDPEYKLNVNSIESSADGMTNTGDLILKTMKERTYISGVFGHESGPLAELQATINDARVNTNPEVSVSIQMSDGSILSNTGVFTGPIVSDGPGTVSLRFESALDFIES